MTNEVRQALITATATVVAAVIGLVGGYILKPSPKGEMPKPETIDYAVEIFESATHRGIAGAKSAIINKGSKKSHRRV